MSTASGHHGRRWSTRALVGWLAGVSALLLVARAYAAAVLGFGDAEALYATYVAHPAPTYVDHPGFVAVLGAIAGGGSIPSPRAAHALTAILATALPLSGVLAARLAGAPSHRAVVLGLVLATCPELAIGLFGLTPDLPFALFTLAAIGLGSAAIRTGRDSFSGDLALLGAAACAGLATLSKLPGLALVAWVPLIAFGRRPRWLVLGATALSLLIVSPLLRHEAVLGFPMLAHRFVHTQHAAGFSVRNAAALFGGQLAYVSPPIVLAAFWTARGLARPARRDRVAWALGLLAVAFGLPLALLCLWSRVAEPHWLAPMYLPIAIAWARRPPRATITTRLRTWLLPIGGGLVALVHVYVLSDLFPRLAGSSYDGRYDLANDMRMFPAAAPTLREALAVARLRGPTVVVVAPHWTLAAQLATVLPPGTRISTASPEDDDFTRWVRPEERDGARVVLFVRDERFASAPLPATLRDRRLESAVDFRLQRGGRVVRTLEAQTYGAARALGDLSPGIAPR